MLKCRSRWIDGSATLTMEASSTTMNWPMQTMPRTIHDGTYRPGSSSIATLPLELVDMISLCIQRSDPSAPAGSNVGLPSAIPTLGIEHRTLRRESDLYPFVVPTPPSGAV